MPDFAPPQPEPPLHRAHLTLEYRTAGGADGSGTLHAPSLLSLACAVIACPATPLVVLRVDAPVLRDLRSDLGLAALLFCVVLGIVAGQVGWRETRADPSRRGRELALVGMALNVLWFVLYVAAVTLVAWVARHGLA
jgi:hypothetical protein